MQSYVYYTNTYFGQLGLLSWSDAGEWSRCRESGRDPLKPGIGFGASLKTGVWRPWECNVGVWLVLLKLDINNQARLVAYKIEICNFIRK